jgi:tetratricopeptide (TPR) repeat protein
MHADRARHYARARFWQVLGNHAKAFAAYRAAFAAQPSDALSARQLGWIAAQEKQWAVAEKWFDTVLALTADSPEDWFNLGFVQGHGGRPTAARNAFSRAVRLNPQHDRAWYGLGMAEAALARHGEAAAAFEKVVELQPMNGEAFYLLGMAYQHLGRPAEVTRIIDALTKFDPSRARLLENDFGLSRSAPGPLAN